MCLQNIIGIIILSAVIIGIFIMTAKDMGIWEAIKDWLFALTLTGILVVGAYLATRLC